MKRVAIIGSTGSIGQQTLDVIASHPDTLQLVGVAARSQIELLAGQVARFAPPLVSVWEEHKAKELSRSTGRRDILVGAEGLLRVATDPRVDVVVVASSGRDALPPLVPTAAARWRCFPSS